jgi:hypothetical protein
MADRVFRVMVPASPLTTYGLTTTKFDRITFVANTRSIEQHCGSMSQLLIRMSAKIQK